MQQLPSFANWLDEHPTFRLMRIDTDIMEPTFSRGDLIVFDAAVTSITYDHVYVIEGPNGVPSPRRIQSLIAGGFNAICDNPRYPMQHVARHEEDRLTVLGRVTAHFRRI